jgi:prevent-host-death family protein
VGHESKIPRNPRKLGLPEEYDHGYITMVTKELGMEMKAAEFKAKCLELMDQVAESGQEIVITKRGKPIAKLVPMEEKPLKPLFGSMAGTGEILGDIISPIDVKWEADE